MRKTWAIIQREYLERVRSRWFAIATIFGPLLFGALMYLPAYAAMRRAMRTAFGRDAVTTGQGGSIPLATALAELVPDAEIMLLGVEEPASRIHAPGESEGDHQRWTHEKVGFDVLVDARLEVTIAAQHTGSNQIILGDYFLNARFERPRVPNAGGAAVTNQLKT